jgi:prevent-host-death family protein
MTTVNVHEAKTNLSRLLERAERGEEVIIARDGKPVARLVALPRQRIAGDLVGKMAVPEAFFDALPEDMLAPFGPPAMRKKKKQKKSRRK